MWLGTSSIKGLSSPDAVTHLSAIVGGLSRSGGASGSAPAYSYYSHTRQVPQIVHLVSSCYHTHTTHATGKTHRFYNSLSSYYYMCAHTIKYASFYYMCVVVLLYICALNNESFCGYFDFSGATRRPQYLAASYYYICVLILVYI